MCIVGLGVPQPIMLVNISDLGKKLEKEELIERLENKLESVNSTLFNYLRVSTIVICKDEWTPQNEILTPTISSLCASTLSFRIFWFKVPSHKFPSASSDIL